MLNRLLPKKFHHLCPAYEGYFVIAVKPNEAHVDPRRAAKRLRKCMAILIYADQWLSQVIGDPELTACPVDIARNITRILEVLRNRKAPWNMSGQRMRPTNMSMDCFSGVYDCFNELQNAIKSLTGVPIYVALSNATKKKIHKIVDRIRLALRDLLFVLQGMLLRKQTFATIPSPSKYPHATCVEMICQTDEDIELSSTQSHGSSHVIDYVYQSTESLEKPVESRSVCTDPSFSVSSLSETLETTAVRSTPFVQQVTDATSNADTIYHLLNRFPTPPLALPKEYTGPRSSRTKRGKTNGDGIKTKNAETRGNVRPMTTCVKSSEDLEDVKADDRDENRPTSCAVVELDPVDSNAIRESRRIVKDDLSKLEIGARSGRRKSCPIPSYSRRHDTMSCNDTAGDMKVTYPRAISTRSSFAVDGPQLSQKLHELWRSASIDTDRTSATFADSQQAETLSEAEFPSTTEPLILETYGMTRSLSRLSSSTAVTDSQSPKTSNFPDCKPPSGLVQNTDTSDNLKVASWHVDDESLICLDKSRRFSLSYLAELQRIFGSRLEQITINASREEMKRHSRLASEIAHDGHAWRFTS